LLSNIMLGCKLLNLGVINHCKNQDVCSKQHTGFLVLCSCDFLCIFLCICGLCLRLYWLHGFVWIMLCPLISAMGII
jgi:hypothetical protein